MKIARVGQLGRVATGIVTGRLKEMGSAPPIPMLTIKSFSEDGGTEDGLVAIKVNRTDVQRFINEVGDVVITARGNTPKSMVIDSRLSGSILGPNLIRIRLDQSLFLPILLAYYIGLPETQIALMYTKTGSTTPNLTVKDVEMLTMKIPPPDKQQDLVRFIELIGEYESALKKASQLRRLGTNQIISESLTPSQNRANI